MGTAERKRGQVARSTNEDRLWRGLKKKKSREKRISRSGKQCSVLMTGQQVRNELAVIISIHDL